MVGVLGFEVVNFFVFCWWCIVVDNGYVIVVDVCFCFWSFIVCYFVEVFGGVILILDVVVCVEWIWIEGVDVGVCGRSDCFRFLWFIYCIGDGKGYWWGFWVEVDFGVGLKFVVFSLFLSFFFVECV